MYKEVQKPGPSLTGRQREVLGALEQRSKKLAMMYLGGLTVLADEANPDRLALCACALRGLTDEIPNYYEVPLPRTDSRILEAVGKIREQFAAMISATKCRATRTQWNGRIDAPLKTFLFEIEEFMGWFDQPNPDIRNWHGDMLRKVKGHDGKLPGQIIDPSFNDWRRIRKCMNEALHHGRADESRIREELWNLEKFLLTLMRPLIFDEFDEFDALQRAAELGDVSDCVERALALINRRPANRQYFFAKLSSPNWLRPLAEQGLFNSPPAPVVEVDSVSFPFWNEGQYLANMAAFAPEHVVNIIEAIPHTDNIRIHENYCEAACKMPGPLAARLAKRELAWLAKQDHIYSPLPERVGELIAHLATSGEHEAALGIAHALLVTGASSSRKAPRPRFDTWQCERLLETRLPVLFDAIPKDTVELLSDLLENVLTAEESVETPPHDYSYIWRPAIEDHAQNGPQYEFRDALIGAIRDYAVRLIQEQLVAPSDVLAMLARRGWHIFVRLAHHVLVECHSLAAAEACSYVLDKSNFDCDSIRHEYQRLQRVVFPKLSQSQQETILQWIEELTAESVTDLRRVDQFLLHKLINLDGLLPENWQSRLDEIRNRLFNGHKTLIHSRPIQRSS